LCNFGTHNPDEAQNPLFAEGDRNRWYLLQPYLICLLMSKGVPMLWQGEEFAENYFSRISEQAGYRCCGLCVGTSSMTIPVDPSSVSFASCCVFDV